MTYTYKTQGTCSKLITIDIDEDGQTIQNVSYTGGCNGNLKGIAALVKGRKIDEVKNTLAGIKCGFKQTSCPDQLAKALDEIEKKNAGISLHTAAGFPYSSPLGMLCYSLCPFPGSFSGGGHINSAGAQFDHTNMDEAIKALKATIDQMIEEGDI